jgi:sporulation protein YlmC with PRC-barrel domain
VAKLVYITEEQYMPAHALKSKELIGLRVLSKSGIVVGKISELHLESNSLRMLGVVVSGSKKVYVGKNYFQKITPDSLILNIDPTIFLIGKQVMTFDGQLLGTVKEVKRKGHTNDLKEIVVKSFMKKRLVITPDKIQSTSNTIILSRHYHGKQKYFWQNS